MRNWRMNDPATRVHLGYVMRTVIRAEIKKAGGDPDIVFEKFEGGEFAAEIAEFGAQLAKRYPMRPPTTRELLLKELECDWVDERIDEVMFADADANVSIEGAHIVPWPFGYSPSEKFLFELRGSGLRLASIDKALRWATAHPEEWRSKVIIIADPKIADGPHRLSVATLYWNRARTRKLLTVKNVNPIRTAWVVVAPITSEAHRE